MCAPSILGMHFSMALQERLAEDRRRVEQEEERKRYRFSATWRWNLRRLKRLDPDWETWYDAQPEQTCDEMLPLILERIEACKLAAEQKEANDRAAAELLAEWAGPYEAARESGVSEER